MRAAIFLVLLLGCTPKISEPATLDISSNEMCAFCRMVISDLHFAAQLLEPGQEPRFFDDIGCLRDYLARETVAAKATAYVADHLSTEWVLASLALYTRVPGLATPMSSELVAHANEASRAADAATAGGTPVTREELFGGRLPEVGP